MLYSQRAWDQRQGDDRAESTYSMARSESPSEYSRRAWDSTASFSEDLIQNRPDSFAPSMRTHDDPFDDEEATNESMNTIGSSGNGGAVGETDSLAIDGTSQLQRGISVLGPKTRFVTRAPWEPGGEDDLEEEAEDPTPEAETRSLFGGRGRPKKQQPKESVAPLKPRQFPASFAPRASSSSRPSVDVVSTPTSSSSGGKARQTGRPGSAGTAYSNGSEALPFPNNARYERPVISSPRNFHREVPPLESIPSHPYANPDNSSIYEDRNEPPISPTSVYPPASPLAAKPPSTSDHHSHGSHMSPSAPSREIPPTPGTRAIPQKMAPWQYTPSSPTFQLVSLEEAQALKARQRQMSLGATEQAPPRMRTVSGPSRKASVPSAEHAHVGHMEDGTHGRTLKGRRSLMGLFARGKEKDRSRPDSPPPPVPVLSHQPSPVSGNTSPLPPVHTPTTATPPRQPPQPEHRVPKRVPPPALNVVVTSPQPQIRRQDSDPLAPPPAIRHLQKSATPPPSFESRAPVRKQTSAATLSPTEGLARNKPSSAPSNIQGFTGLSLRPMSTMFSSMPLDYLATTTPVPSIPHAMSTSNSGQFSTQSPTTPSLWSSRSESISTGSSEMPPFTPGGIMPSLSSMSSSMDGGAHSINHLQKQVYGARENWKTQIQDLEAQVRALKAEVAELRQAPCPECGHLGGGGSCMERPSVVNRPRAKTAAGNQRTLFGNGD